MGVDRTLVTMTEDDWETSLRVNARGTFPFADTNERYESRRAALETFLSLLERWRAERGAANSDDLVLLIGRHLAAELAP